MILTPPLPDASPGKSFKTRLGVTVGDFGEHDVKASGRLTYKTGEEAADIRRSVGGTDKSLMFSLAFAVKDTVDGELSRLNVQVLIFEYRVQLGRIISHPEEHS